MLPPLTADPSTRARFGKLSSRFSRDDKSAKHGRRGSKPRPFKAGVAPSTSLGAGYPRWGLVAFYKYASEYGKSYVRPVLWLLLVLLVFALLYPVAGLRYDITRDRAAVMEPGRVTAQTAGPLLTYWHPLWGSGDKRPWPRLALVGHSFVSTLSVAAFRKDLSYEPRYPWGDPLLEVAEQILTSTLVALFLLAVRRQFKR